MNLSTHEVQQQRIDAFGTIQALHAEMDRSAALPDILREEVVTAAGVASCLFEGIPGEGKTFITSALATAMGGQFRRHQGTPDSMPKDITGYSYVDLATKERKFQPGPVLESNVFLGDELNRNTAKTLAAMLEAMGEGHVTIDGITYNTMNPMTWFGTQNPQNTEEGTNILPVAQTDRFAYSISAEYDDAATDAIINHYIDSDYETQQVVDTCAIVGLRKAIKTIQISGDMRRRVRAFNNVLLSAEAPTGSDRSEVMPVVDRDKSIIGNRVLLRTIDLARYHALSRGKNIENVANEDIVFAQKLAYPHRTRLSYEAQSEGYTAAGVVAKAIELAA